MHALLILAAVYGTLNAQMNFVNAPKVVHIDGYNTPTWSITEPQANALGYKLLVDERHACASNEYAVATGYAEDTRIRRTYRIEKVVPQPRRIYKYDLSSACIEYGEITNLVTLISADVGTKWMWDCAEILVENDPYFIAATNEVIRSGIIAEPKVRKILDRAYQLGQTTEVVK